MGFVKKKVVGELVYVPEYACYGLKVGDDLVRNRFHFGERMEVQINGKWVFAIMDKDENGRWSLRGTECGGKLNGLIVRACKNCYSAF